MKAEMGAIYLQSMTDFCLEILDENPPYNEVLMLIKISNYATFLKQPLQLGFFVPCDENGNVLEEPKKWESFLFDPCRCDLCIENTIECENYKKAKERVLFNNPIVWNDFNEMETLKIENNFFAWKKDKMVKFELNDISKNETIEDLVMYNLQLSETAIKQIGL